MLILYTLFLTIVPRTAYAQTGGITVSGTVKDGDGNTLPGVTIKIQNTQTGTVTDALGNYKIKIPNAKAVLVFSFIGYSTQLRPTGNQTVINVTLKEIDSKLNEVVVVGYGSQKRRDVTGAIASIKSDQMDTFAGGSLNTSLQGKIAGLQITTDSGEPGAGANFTLRGVSSVNGNSSPLIIIDGLPVNNDSFTSAQDGATFSPLNDLNPSDIESIEVLKDAATASIYGARASNGVILITTKSGKGQRPQISFSQNASSVGLYRKIGILNGPEWRSAYTEAIYNSTGALTTKVSVIDSLHPYYRDSYDWQDVMYRRSLQYKTDVSVRGSSKDNAMDYYVSAGFRNLAPIIIETNYKQAYASARTNYKISSFLRGSTNFNLSNYTYNRLNTGNSTSSVMFTYLVTMPVYSPYDPITGQIINLFDGSKPSPLAQAIYSTNKIERSRLLGQQEFVLTLAKGLDIRSTLGVDYSNTNTYYFSPPQLSTATSPKSVFSIYNPIINNSLVNENTITYQKSFNNHNINVLFGESYQFNKTNNLNLRGSGFIDNVITTIGGAANIDLFTQSITQSVLQSFFSRVNYNYKSKYLFSALLRRDGSSRFGADNRYAYFPSVSGGWRFTEEKFLNTNKILDGKLRASYGITGNQNIGDYASTGSYSNAGKYLGAVSVISDGLPNPNLKWETTRQFDIGTDLTFFSGRFNLSVDYYVKNTNDLLFNVQIPSQTGYSTIPYNFGGLSNKGVDIQLDGMLINKKVKWSSVVTFGLNRNKITSLPDGQDYRPTALSLARVGYPVGVFYGYRSLGVYAHDADNVYKTDANGTVIPFRKGSATGAVYKGGDEIYQDVNGDGIINDKDLQIIGNPTPQFFGGFQNTVSYKSFSLAVFVNYVIGNKIFNNLTRSIDGYQFDGNYTIDQVRRWKKQGDITDVPRLVKGDPMENYAPSSRFVEDGSFIRVQNLTLTYRLPGKLLSRVGIRNGNVGLGVNNLAVFGRYTGYDPEVSAGNNPLGFGIDNASFPKSRSYNLSLNISF
ncbi:TonB-dependent receptor [Mucilaginibacter sp. RS28]|uniref:TonB-dependent receptor n=1 Tax=Mucilaginibacter straminoryzae TaxID=2932774 RepID=A0A9X1X0Y1_9SPHI|nr:TonB-dependent receptor [Mucilaginibacter straminoryzae]